MVRLYSPTGLVGSKHIEHVKWRNSITYTCWLSSMWSKMLLMVVCGVLPEACDPLKESLIYIRENINGNLGKGK